MPEVNLVAVAGGVNFRWRHQTETVDVLINTVGGIRNNHREQVWRFFSDDAERSSQSGFFARTDEKTVPLLPTSNGPDGSGTVKTLSLIHI